MAPTVDPPDPPELSNRGVPSSFDAEELASRESDLRRGDVETALHEGAWREAFEEWAEYTDLSPETVGVLDERGIFQRFDFYWHPGEEALAVEPPSLPADLDGVRDEDADRGTVQRELRDLGETVLETLATDYLDWTASDEYVWGDEQFGESPDAEE